jgi:hypothetical protein
MYRILIFKWIQKVNNYAMSHVCNKTVEVAVAAAAAVKEVVA